MSRNRGAARSWRRACGVSCLLGALAISHGSAQQAQPQADDQAHRNFDARLALLAGADDAAPTSSQQAALDVLRADIPGLAATFDRTTGATRTMWNPGGYLTPADTGTPREIADRYIVDSLAPLGLTADDVAERELTDRVYSRVTGATHLYYRQRIRGIPVYNAQLHVNVNRDGRITSVNNSFLPEVAAASSALSPGLDAVAAVRSAASHLNLASGSVQALRVDGARPQHATEVAAADLSVDPITARLMLLPIRRGEARLVWNFQVRTTDRAHAYDFTVDADTGGVWSRTDWIASDQYRVYPRPVESPNHASPAPPADARSVESNTHYGIASPFGWHDVDGVGGAEYTILRGNNVHAYSDELNGGTPPPVQPDCGPTIDCTFPLDLTQPPSAYRSAAITNLFYWSNLIHDIQYQYGFDEAAGNFQVNNYGRGGLGNDDVRAEGQDAAGTDNANFFTPPDGARPRMQMYLWTQTAPMRDGDFDNGIIVHEYGHGISNRLVGGPSNVSCLANQQQPGEGLSDWWSLVYTAAPGDTGPTPRGMGTYVLGQPRTGPGIRDLRYSTDPAVNNWTYATVGTKFGPHAIGSVWAQGMWRVYWALVDRYGYSPELQNAFGGFGNQRAMLYVNEGLKHTICSPAFTDVRDGILQAAADNYGGADVCLLWDAFAAFGLGSDAVSNGPNSRAPINGFNKPVACGGQGLPAVSIADVSVAEGDYGSTPATFTVALSRAVASDVRIGYATTAGTARTDVAVVSADAMTIPSSGPASVYPSSQAVAGVAGVIHRLRVRLDNFSHTWPADVDVMLVGPGGQKAMLLSDAGGSTPISSVTLTFADGAAVVPAALATGTYAPVDVSSGDFFPPPAPSGPYPASLAGFVGTDPNGTWSLYVYDDLGGLSGSLGGWTLLISTGAEDFEVTSGEITIPAGALSQTITVPVHGDLIEEADETFSIALRAPTYVTMADAEAVATIVDDDAGVTRVPGAAALLSPLPRQGLDPTFQWHAVYGAKWYQLFVSDRAGVRVDQWYTSGQAGCATSAICSITPNVVLNAGDVYWWVRTWSPAGFGPWSAAGSFHAARDHLIVGLGRGGGALASWARRSSAVFPEPPMARQATIDLPWPAYTALNGELHPAAGDLDGDGLDEIVVGLGAGGGGWMAIFDDASRDFALIKWIRVPWTAYNDANGTTWPAVGDIDGDGRAEIVAGLGQGGGGYIALFEDATTGYAFNTWRRTSWASYNETGSGDTHPAVVQAIGGGAAEIVLGLGAGGHGYLEILDGALRHLRWVQVSWPDYTAGPGETFPAGGDLDGDGHAELVVGLSAAAQGWVEVIDDPVAGAGHLNWLKVELTSTAAVGETHPAVGNLDADGALEIAIGVGPLVGSDGAFQVRDDAASGYSALGWTGVGRQDLAGPGTATFPAIGRLR